MAVSSLLAPLSVLDERLSRANARSRSLALNALHRPLHHRPATSSRVPPLHAHHHSKGLSATPMPVQARAVNTSKAINTVVSSNGGATGGARKAKYGIGVLKDDIIEAKELQKEEIISDADKEAISPTTPAVQVQPINLLDVAVTKPLKGKQALHAEYELVHKPSVIALDESVGDLLDAEWEKVDSDGEVEDAKAREGKEAYAAGWPTPAAGGR